MGIMASLSITLMPLDTLIMSVSLLELTMVMDMLLAMVPLATEDTMDMVTMDMPTMVSMESVMLNLSLMLILGQIHHGLPVHNAYATGHPHNVGVITGVDY